MHTGFLTKDCASMKMQGIDLWAGTAGQFEWPRPLKYEHRIGSRRNVQRFLYFRPGTLISSERQLYSLDLGTEMWRPASDHEIAAEIAQTDRLIRLGNDEIRKMVGSVHLDFATSATPNTWIISPEGDAETDDIAIFQNGLLNLRSMTLTFHTRHFFATATPSYDYDRKATCPLFLQFLDQVLHPSFHPTIQEWMGLLLTSSTKYHKIMQLIGATRGGKGTILRVAEKMVGRANAGSTSMDSFSERFGLEGLENCRLIFIPDARDASGKSRSRALERLLMIGGGDPVDVDRKNKPALLSRQLPGKIMIAANKPLSLLDDTGAYGGRCLILNFEKSFLGKEDPDLDAKLATELSGIANWAIRGLKRLRRNGRFSVGNEGRKAAEEIVMAGSPCKRFIRDHIKVTEVATARDCIRLDDLFEGYRIWANHFEKMNSKDIRGRNQFIIDFLAALRGREVTHTDKKFKNPVSGKWEHLRGVYGIQWKDRPNKPDVDWR